MIKATVKDGKISIDVEGEFSDILAQYTTIGFYIYKKVANDAERKFMEENWNTDLNPIKHIKKGDYLQNISEELEDELENLITKTIKALDEMDIRNKEDKEFLKIMRKEVVKKIDELPENLKNGRTGSVLNKLLAKIDSILDEKDYDLKTLFKNIFGGE